MFDASKIIGKQISSIIGTDGDISTLLSSLENREFIRNETISMGFSSDAEILDRSLQRLWVSYTAYNLHRARNIYNDAYANWWKIAGEKWQNHIQMEVSK